MRALFAALVLSVALAAAGARAQSGAGEPGTAVQTAPLDLNRATEAELQELPGIGPAKARAILAFRSEHGRFVSVSQLLRIKGFGRATLRRLRPLLTVGPPDPASQAPATELR